MWDNKCVCILLTLSYISLISLKYKNHCENGRVTSLEQERIPDPSSLRRKQHEEHTYDEPHHQRHCINNLPRQSQVITAQNITMHHSKGQKRNQRKRRMEHIAPSQRIIRWHARPGPPTTKVPYPLSCRQPIVQPPAARPKAVSEGEEQARAS